MEQSAQAGRHPAPARRFKRVFIIGVLLGVVYVPGFVALAMILTGNAG
jgi:hypothetical protein